MNVLPLSESHAEKLAVDAAMNGHGVKCGYSSQSVEVDGKVAALRGRNDDGHYKIAHAAASGPSSALACRRRRRSVGRLAGSSRPPEIPDAKNYTSDNKHPEPPETPGLLAYRRFGRRVGPGFR